MFEKIISRILYAVGAVTIVVGLSIAGIIVLRVPGYFIPAVIGTDMIVAGALAQVALRNEPSRVAR